MDSIHQRALEAQDGHNVVAFPQSRARSKQGHQRDDWPAARDALTYALAMHQHAQGRLPEGVLSALLIGAGVAP
jgi:hypothetical protein